MMTRPTRALGPLPPSRPFVHERIVMQRQRHQGFRPLSICAQLEVDAGLAASPAVLLGQLADPGAAWTVVWRDRWRTTMQFIDRARETVMGHCWLIYFYLSRPQSGLKP